MATYFAFPYWLTLRILRPWRASPACRSAAKRLMDPFMWVNNLWVIVPLLVGEYLVSGRVTWLLGIVSYIAVALLLHSAIAHSTEAVLRAWEAAPAEQVNDPAG